MANSNPDRSGYFTIPVAPDFLLEISKGTMPNYESVRIVGFNSSVGTTEETVWPEPIVWTPLASATALYISSTSTSDTTQEITVEGVDANYDEVTFSATLNGQTQVSLGTMLRVNKTYISTAGAELNGSVYVAESTALTAGKPTDTSKIQDILPLDSTVGKTFAVSPSAIYTVPAGHTLFMIVARMYVENIGTNKDMTFWLKRDTSVNEGAGILFCGDLGTGAEDLPLSGFRRIEEKSTISFSAASVNPGFACSMSIDAILIKNTEF